MNNLPCFEIVKIIIGIAFLLVSGEFLIRGGLGLAQRFKISNLFIGLTVVAFGTSAPELFVTMSASLTGRPEMAVGNIIGSNIVNIALLMAVFAISLPLTVTSKTIQRSWPVLFISGLALYASMYNGSISRFEGLIMVALFIAVVFGSNFLSKKDKLSSETIQTSKGSYFLVYMLMILGASIGLALGSKYLIDGTSVLATHLGVTERIVSLTVIAIGTCMPELVVIIAAARKRETAVAVGSLIGSNIFNVFAIMGITAGIQVVSFKFSDFKIDLNFMLFLYILLLFFMLPLKSLFKRGSQSTFLKRFKNMRSGKITRIKGAIFLILYVCYLFFILKK